MSLRLSLTFLSFFSFLSIGAIAVTPSDNPDPYAWLEDVHGAKPLAWVTEQNKKSLGVLKADPRYQKNYDSILEVLDAPDRIPSGSLRHGFVYNFWQDAKNPKRARLTKVEADLTQGQGWINADAGSGLADMDAGLLQLGGGINIFSDTGYELHTKSAFVDLKKGVMHGHDAVTGQGPMGELKADEFHYDRDAKLLTLSGHVQMTILGSKT